MVNGVARDLSLFLVSVHWECWVDRGISEEPGIVHAKMCILIPLPYRIMPGLSMRYATAGRTGAVNCSEEEGEVSPM